MIITKENIEEIYSSLSEKDIDSLSSSNLRDVMSGTPIITTILSGRFCKIREALKVAPQDFDNYKVNRYGIHDAILQQTLFGVKDTLKPIDEYIEEIKASSEYKEYIFNLDFDNLDFDNWNALRDFIEKYRKIHINLMEHIDGLRYMAKQIKEEYISTK